MGGLALSGGASQRSELLRRPMPLEMPSQLLCRHVVDSRSALVAHDRPQRCRHVLAPDDFFHQSLVHRFLSGFHVAFHLPSCAVVLDGLHPWASLRPKGGDRCCRALRLLEARASGNRLPLALFFYLSALRSSRLSTDVFTTMASADSPLALTRGVSPGKVRKLSRRAVRLYPPRFFDSLWASYSLVS